MTVIGGKKVDFVCINVATNDKRRAHMQRQKEAAGIPLRFFEAITPQTPETVENDYREARTRLWWGRAFIPGEYACCLSHISVWRGFMDSDDDYLMVFEDDVNIVPEFMQVVSQVLALPVALDFVKFSGRHRRPSIKNQAIGFGDYALYTNAYGPIDAACYLLSQAGARRLERYCSKMHLAVDVMMDRSYEHGATCYCIRPYPAEQINTAVGDMASEIGIEERLKKYDHNNIVLKTGTRCLRYYTSLRKHWATLKLKIGG